MIIKETFPHFFLAYILFEACLKRASLQKVSTSHLHVSALICSSNKPVTWNAHQVFHRISPHQPLIGWRHLSVGEKEKKKKKRNMSVYKTFASSAAAGSPSSSFVRWRCDSPDCGDRQNPLCQQVSRRLNVWVWTVKERWRHMVRTQCLREEVPLAHRY